MNRGSSAFGSCFAPLASGFNEAPIHESGKSSSVTIPILTVARFNEAPIHESGKSPAVGLPISP